MALPNGTSEAITSKVPMNINPLLHQLEPFLKRDELTISTGLAEEIAYAVSNIFSNQLAPEQTSILLHDLYLTGFEQHPQVLAKCAAVMRAAAEPVDQDALLALVKKRTTAMNSYDGGLCDVVGTGGDRHKTFNISTAASIICSSLLVIAKHGNRASTSRSGSSDVLGCLQLSKPPRLDVVGPDALERVYGAGNYGFLFAPNFHKGLAHVAGLRKQLPHPSLFNLLGPLTNPAGAAIEARVVGVKRKDLVPVFAEALRLSGAKKAMVVCGDEDLDEISCAGITHCARLREIRNALGEEHVVIERFTLQPADFGFQQHPLVDVAPGKTPEENAELLLKILRDEISTDSPVLHFVLMNAAALFVVSGVCDGDKSALGDDAQVDTTLGPGGGRWREGVRLGREALRGGKALDMVMRFATETHKEV